MSSTLSKNQLNCLQYVVGNKATILTAGVVKLHHASKQEKKWVYTELCGALCLIMDRELGGVAIFRMFDLNRYEMIFESELYYDFDKHYYEINDYFYCFEVPGGFMIGFSFADSNEAIKFKNEIAKYAPKAKVEIEERKKSKGDKKPKKNIKTFEDEANDYELNDHYHNMEISRPHSFVHDNHIGWDTKKQCFDISQLSKELKKIFKNAGIRKKDLQNTDTALIIVDAILNQPLPERDMRLIKNNIPQDQASSENPNETKDKQLTNSEKRAVVISGIVGTPLKPPPLTLGKPLDPPPLTISTKLGTTTTNMPKPPPLDLLKISANINPPDPRKSIEPKVNTSPMMPERSNLLEEIRNGIKLKPVTTDIGGTSKMTKQQEISLTSKLAIAINKRREDLTKYDISSEEDDNNWSDSD